MNRKKLILTGIAVLLVLALAVPAASSYFTTYVRVPGSKTLHLQDGTEFGETPTEGGGKHVVIKADENSDPVFVRVLIMAPKDVLDALLVTNGGGSGSWEDAGDSGIEGSSGYWYFSEPIKDGETAEMDIDLPEGFKYDGDSFNVVVLHEYVPAEPDGSGGLKADWKNTDLDITVEEGEAADDGGSGSDGEGGGN